MTLRVLLLPSSASSRRTSEATQGAASRLVALGGDLNASATLLGGALAEGDAVAGRLSAVESTLQRDGERRQGGGRLAQRQHVDGGAGGAVVRKGGGAGDAVLGGEGRAQGVPRGGRHGEALPKKLEVALKEEAKADAPPPTRPRCSRRRSCGLTDAAAFVAEPGKDGEGGPPPGRAAAARRGGSKQAAVPHAPPRQAAASCATMPARCSRRSTRAHRLRRRRRLGDRRAQGEQGPQGAGRLRLRRDGQDDPRRAEDAHLARDVARRARATRRRPSARSCDALAASYAAAAPADATATALLTKAQSKVEGAGGRAAQGGA